MVDEKSKELLVRIYKMGYIEALHEAGRYARQARTMTEFLLYLNSKFSVLDDEIDKRQDEIFAIAEKIEKEILEKARERPVPAEVPELQHGETILFCEEKPSMSVEYFDYLVKKNVVKGLCLTRRPKELFIDKKSLDILVVWLASSGDADEEGHEEQLPMGLAVVADAHPDSIPKTQDIRKLTDIIGNYIQQNKPPVIFLEGINYLTVQTDFSKVLKFIQWLGEQIVRNDGFFVLSVHPDALQKVEFEKLKDEFTYVF